MVIRGGQQQQNGQKHLIQVKNQCKNVTYEKEDALKSRKTARLFAKMLQMTKLSALKMSWHSSNV